MITLWAMKILRYIPIVVLVAVATGCSPDGAGRGGLTRKLFGPSPKQLVVQMFESEDPDLRRNAIERLSKKKWGRRGAYPKAYAIMTTDSAATVRSAAVRALGRVGDAKYAKEVIAALSDRESSVRWDAAVTLDSIFAPEAVGPLSLRANSDESPDVRIASARALRHYRQPDVLETLLRCLDDPKLAVRCRAAESLTELTGESAGTDAHAWRRILNGKTDPFATTSPAKNKAWWKWF
jgi:HEAT repeat protein